MDISANKAFVDTYVCFSLTRCLLSLCTNIVVDQLVQLPLTNIHSFIEVTSEYLTSLLMSHGNSISNFIGFIPTTSGTCNIVRKQNQFYQQFRYVFYVSIFIAFFSCVPLFCVCFLLVCFCNKSYNMLQYK